MRGIPSTSAACLVADTTAAGSNRFPGSSAADCNPGIYAGSTLHRDFSVTSRCPFLRTPGVHASQKAALAIFSWSSDRGIWGVDPPLYGVGAKAGREWFWNFKFHRSSCASLTGSILCHSSEIQECQLSKSWIRPYVLRVLVTILVAVVYVQIESPQ